jgi:membrane associated rhomboid family serine protease
MDSVKQKGNDMVSKLAKYAPLVTMFLVIIILIIMIWEIFGNEEEFYNTTGTRWPVK